MRRSKINLLVDAATLVAMLAMVCTGLIIRYILPPGSGGHGGGRGLVLWGMDRHEWGGLHFWLAVAVVGLLLVHVVLHWPWIMGVVRRLGGGKASSPSARREVLYGFGFLSILVLLVGGFYWDSGRNVKTVFGQSGSRESRRAIGVDQDHPHTSAERCEGDQRPTPFLSSRHVEATGHRREDPGQRPARGRGDRSIRGDMTLQEVADQTGATVDRIKTLLRLPGDTSIHERVGRLRRVHGFQMSDLRRITTGAGGEQRSHAE